MGLLTRILGGKPVEQRRSGFAAYPGSLSYGSGYYAGVSTREAEALSACVACIELITGSIASLPPELVQDTEAGSVPAPPTAAAWRVIRRPNRWQSWPSFMSWAVGQYLLFGNAAAWIQTDGRGGVSGLVPMPWPWLSVQAVSGADGPRMAYDVMQGSPDSMLLGLPMNRRLLDDEVLHIRARSDFGAIGRSVLSRAPASLREGLTIATMAQKNWENGARPSMVFEIEKWMDETRRKRFREETMQEIAGALNAGGYAILEGGMTAKGMSLSSVDSEFLATRGFNVSEVCRLFGVPEQLLQPGPRAIADLTPFLSTFATMALTPIVTAIESEIDFALLPAGVHLHLDMGGLMRGSFSAVTAAMAALVQSGIVSPNDARAELGWSPRADGEPLRVSAAPNYPADFKGSTALHPSPGPRKANGLAEPGTHANEGSS